MIPLAPGIQVCADTACALTCRCDSCGVYPIYGRCWTCDVCTTQRPDMGFDLCDECFQAGRHMSGRFAQQHTAGAGDRSASVRPTSHGGADEIEHAQKHAALQIMRCGSGPCARLSCT